MPELKLTVPPELFEAIQAAAALNEMSLQDVARIMLQSGLDEQRSRQRAD